MEIKSKKIINVIENKFCIGCGSCAYSNNNVEIEKNKHGLLEAKVKSFSDVDDYVCPFASSDNEDSLAERLLSDQKNINYDENIGYYINNYAFKDLDISARSRSSSGGGVTWLIKKLFDNKEIDGVIHVAEDESKSSGVMFKYCISHSFSEADLRRKSQYYPNNFNEALENIDLSKKYAFVGIPCYIKAVRLLCEKDEKLKNSIRFFIGIFCGHMKSSAFAELFAWQQGVLPSELKKIDFRVKRETGLASKYEVEVTDKNNDKHKALSANLYGADWGLGLFKPLACEWCDDITAETADVVFGDAWLPEYVNDSLGTNIVTVRDKLINDLFLQAKGDENIFLEEISIGKIYESQAGNYRHRREGLSIRVAEYKKLKKWQPEKRFSGKDYKVSGVRKKLYLHRLKMSIMSHEAFFEAKTKNNIFIFYKKIFPLQIKYYLINKNLIKGVMRTILGFLRFR